MVALTAYLDGVNATTSGLTGSARKLQNATAGLTVAAPTTKVAKNTGYDFVSPQGATGVWAGGASLPTPAGKGWIWEDATLEGNQILSGTMTGTIRLTSSSAFTATVFARVYKRSSAGVYTLIATLASASTSIATTGTNVSLSTANAGGSAAVLTNFPNTGDRLYVDIVLNITVASGSTTATVTPAEGAGANLSIVTTGYQAIPNTAPGNPTGVAVTGAGNQKIVVAWTDETVGWPVPTYTIIRGTDGTAFPTTVVTGLAAGTQTYTDTTASNDVTYYYEVQAVNSSGTGTSTAASGSTTAFTRTNSFEGGTNGTNLSTGNTGGASGNAFDLIGGTTVPTFSNAQAHGGSLSAKTTTANAGVRWNVSNTPTVIYLRAYVYMPVLPTSIAGILVVATSNIVAWIDGTGHLRVGTGNTSTDPSSTATITAGQWFRVELQATVATSTVVRLFLSPEATSPDDTVTYTTTTLSSITQANFFAISGSMDVVGGYYEDDLAVSDVTWIGPVGGAVLTPNRVVTGMSQPLHRSSVW